MTAHLPIMYTNYFSQTGSNKQDTTYISIVKIRDRSSKLCSYEIIQNTHQGSKAILMTSVPTLALPLPRGHSVCRQDLPSTQSTEALLD